MPPAAESPSPPALSANDQERLRAAARLCFDQTVRVLRSSGVPENDVDDAAQQVLLVLAAKLPNLPPGTERPFMLRSATFIARRWRRAGARRRESPDEQLDELGGEHGRPDELCEQRRLRELLDEALAAMSPERRAVLVLVEIEQMSLPEAASVLEIGVPTATSRLLRARAELDVQLKRMAARLSFGVKT